MSDKKFDVGIFGLWYGNNYGSMITYYALGNTLDSLGKSYAMIRNPLGREVDVNTLRRSHPLRFGFEHYNISPFYTLDKMNKHNEMFDAFVLGSDQMWNYGLSRPYKQSYFFDFVDDNKKKISYATSFGKAKYMGPPEEKVVTQKNLKRFDAISVRDDFSKTLCETDFGVSAQTVLDPVFLCPVQKYEDLITESNFRIEGDYIFAYILDPSPERGAAINNAAEKTGLKVYVVFNESSDKQACKESLGQLHENVCFIDEPTVQEWLSLVKHCKFALTDSFHGACFSIIFRRPFIVIKNNKRGGGRFTFLLKTFGLTDYLVDSSANMIEKFNALGIDHQVDYDSAYRRINAEAEKSRQWLSDALNGVRKEEKIEEKKDILDVIDSGNMFGLKMPEKIDDVDLENCKIVASLLKEYNITDIVLSSGTRHVQLVKFFEANDCFRTYNVLDERSAGFFAIGLATKLNRPVACCCTSGTASSNYLTAVSEAYYQHVPVVFITGDRYPYYLDQKEAQMVPQSDMYRGVCRRSVTLPIIGGPLNRYISRRLVCDAIISMTKDVKGPVQIDVPLQNIVKVEPSAYKLSTTFPKIDYVDYRSSEVQWYSLVNKLMLAKVLLIYGQDTPVSDEFTQKLNRFANTFNCVVAREHISNIHCDKTIEMYNTMGFNRISKMTRSQLLEMKPDIVITVNAGTATITRDMMKKYPSGVEHWDIIENGHVEDVFRKLSCVVGCDFNYFLDRINALSEGVSTDDSFYRAWKKYEIANKETPVEYKQSYAVYNTIKQLPKGSLLHIGNSNTIRMANSYTIDPSIKVYCNRGTNGIDGSASTFMGQCEVSDELCFLLIGDLSFFYDMNSLWNKNLKGNIRIMLFNNNGAGLLRHHKSKAITYTHNTQARAWVESVGFKYLSSTNKEEFDSALKEFLSDKSDKAIFFEVFC